MRIAVMGPGGVGGYFGARLVASDQEVHFIGRGAHLEALRSRGLEVKSGNGDVRVTSVRATGDPASVGPVDLVMLTVKLWSTDEALRQAKPLVGPETAVVSFQNGVVAPDAIAQVYGRDRTWGGVAQIAAVIERPGVIRHTGTLANLIVGELDRPVSPRVRAFVGVATGAGIQIQATDDIRQAIWEKYVFLVAASGLTALTRLPLGPIREDPETRALLAQVMAEVVTVARARGVQLDPDLVERLLRRVDGLPREMVASMLGDLERGNRLELPWLSGGVATMGRELGVPTPANQFIATALRLYADGRPAEARPPAP
jgi:2-dehydropantoate 2-reductase